MKKILFKLLSFIVLLFTYTTIFADTKISLISDNTNLDIGEVFNIKVSIETDSTGSLEIVNIDGLNTFTKLGQQTSNRTTIINGEVLNTYDLQLSLRGEEAGNYIIGPVKLHLGNENTVSNTVSIKINEEYSLDESINNGENNKEKKEDIRGLKDPNEGFYMFLIFLIIAVLGLICLYIYNRFFQKEKDIGEDINENDEAKEIIIAGLKSLLKNSGDLNKSMFYKKLNIFFKDYFSVLGFCDTDTLTLTEIKKLSINKSLISLYEKSYLNEFSDKNDTIEEREELINKLLKFVI